MRGMQLALVVGALATTPCLASGTHWNAVHQFSYKKNPAGPWAYSTNSLPLKTDTSYCVSGVKGWFTYQPIPNALGIVRNFTGATVSCQTIRAPLDHLWMDPESGTVTVTWTAPVAGNFTVAGDFLGIDVSEAAHPVTIAGPAGTLFAASIATYNKPAPFRVKVTLAAGQSISFTVANGGGYAFLSTGLKATVTQN